MAGDDKIGGKDSVAITKDHRHKLQAEVTRTGVTAIMLMKTAKDRP